jgi:hypothetical protein
LRILASRIAAMSLVELQKIRRNRAELLTRAIQPARWLPIFGETFTRLRAIPVALSWTTPRRESSPSPRCSSPSSTAFRSSGSAIAAYWPGW